MAHQLAEDIQFAVTAPISDEPKVISPFQLKSSRQNQFLIFLKPEAFIQKHDTELEKILELVFETFDHYQVEVTGSALFPGSTIAKHQIMDRHYGVINYLSKNASEISTEEQETVRHLLHDKFQRPIYGAHELLEEIDLTPDELDEVWLEQPSTKVRSGFYARLMEVDGQQVILINGFHPKQLAHFTNPDRKIVVMVGHSDTPWKVMREVMIGDTYPEKADAQSIRGALNRHPQEYGFQNVTIANNVIHFSAGPTEALFEMDNFLKDTMGVDIFAHEAILASNLRIAGLNDKQIREMLTDKELHQEAELKDTPEVIQIIKEKYNV